MSTYSRNDAVPQNNLSQTGYTRNPSLRQVGLFNAERQQEPNPSLMTHLIPLFFEHMGNEFPFISHDEITSAFWEQRLSPQLANAIASMASRSVLDTTTSILSDTDVLKL
jgi:hypothetical protein